ncbi:CinA family nicotinamide mononucleotide deamidase-related protein [Bacteriovoracales bacterium]|nr:CinA family nicotinamide mononucleotide deamidase-related protein [Bacteriovoracales bacterium]
MKPNRVEVLAIGDELLDGRVADTNTLRLADQLSFYNIRINQRTTITDDIDVIIREIKNIAERKTELCVVSGGLGPTSDDVTAEAFAALSGEELIRDEKTIQKIKQRLQQFNRPVTENQLKQADRPKSSELLINPVGSAVGFQLKYKNCLFVALPGVPKEFDSMVNDHILQPFKNLELRPLEKKVFRSFGLFEAQVDELLSDLPKKWPVIRLGYRAHFPEIAISLKASPEHSEQLQEAQKFVREKLGKSLFSETQGGFAETLIECLKSQSKTLSLAESCSGGLAGHLLTEVPGASEVFSVGLITYSNKSKTEILGVKEDTLKKFGAVSEETVTEMANQVRSMAKTDYGLAISGIAGPGGGTKEKPVGTIWIALSLEHEIITKKLELFFDREKNKIISAHSALDLLRRRLQY